MSYQLGDRVEMTPEARRAFGEPFTGTVHVVYLLSDEYIDVLRDGQKRAKTWASRFWAPLAIADAKA